MALRTPNCTGETGVYVAGSPATITLPGLKLPKSRSFATALADGKLADQDFVGVTVVSATSDSAWGVFMARYTPGSLELLEEEDAGDALTDGESVTVFATVTEKMLTSLAAEGYTPPIAFPFDSTGPDYWDLIDPVNTTYDSGTKEYTHAATAVNNNFGVTATVAGAEAGWNTGFAFGSVSVDIYFPSGASIDNEYANIRMVDADGVEVFTNLGGFTGGTWQTYTLSDDYGNFTSHIEKIEVYSLSTTGTPAQDEFKMRNIVFTAPA